MNYDHLRESSQRGHSILLSTRDDVTQAIRSSFDSVVVKNGKKALALAVLTEADSPLLLEVVKKGALYNYPDLVVFYVPPADVLELLKKKEYEGGHIELEDEKACYFRSKRRRVTDLPWQEENATIESLASEGEHQEAMDTIDGVQCEERNLHILDFHRSRCSYHVEDVEGGLAATNSVSLSVHASSKYRTAVMGNFSFYVKKSLRPSRTLSLLNGKRTSYTRNLFVSSDDKSLTQCSWKGTRVVEGDKLCDLVDADYRIFEGNVYNNNFVFSMSESSSSSEERIISPDSRDVKGILFRDENGEVDGIVRWQPLTLHSGKKYERDNENWSEFRSCTYGIPYREGSLFIVLIEANNKRYHRFVHLTSFSRKCSLPIFFDPLAQVDIISFEKIEDEYILSYRNLLTGASCIAWYDEKRINKHI